MLEHDWIHRSPTPAPRCGWPPRWPLALVAACGLLACTQVEAILDRRSSATPHEAYAEALEAAGLAETALVRRWSEAGNRALSQPIDVEPPYEETAYFSAAEPVAVGYRISLRRGQALQVTARAEPPGAATVFMDLYRSTGGEESLRHVSSAPPGSTRLEFESSREADYLLRVQTELLLSTRLTIRITRAATLAFPVSGHDPGAIRSVFGASRDAGRRQHDGIDIFAPRGTPVVAATDGVVSRTGQNRLGGNVIWLRDERRNQSLYYAHLDRQLVRRGRRVRTGDTLGLVGNTGNARTTPPHLHFGIYRRGEGPVDPVSFIEPQPVQPPPLRLDTGSLGEWGRTTAEIDARLSEGTEERLPAQTLLKLLGAAGRRYRFMTPDGRSGTLTGSVIESATEPLRTRVRPDDAPLLDAPSSFGLTAGRASPGDTLQILGRFGEYLYVESPAGLRGWLDDSP
jgi:murein DD-endopeptidase MepM/ murein hydrolase activator NlpD